MKSNWLIILSVLVISISSCSKEEEEDTAEFPFENKDLKIEWISHMPVWTTEIHFTNELEGIAMANTGDILITEDGGKNWEVVYSNPNLTSYLGFIEFIDDNLGFIAGGKEPDPHGSQYSGSFILRTQDGGKSWEHVYHADSSDIRYLASNDEGHLYAIWLNRYYVSKDGGDSWQKHFLKPFYSMSGMNFSDGKGYCVGTKGGFFRSSDNGRTWNHEPMAEEFNLGPIAFQGSTGFMMNNSGEILRSNDYGENWEDINPQRDAYYSAIQYFEKSRVISKGSVIGLGGWSVEKAGFLYSVDDGNTWDQVLFKSHTFFDEINMYSEDEGFINGGNKLFKITFK